jgi:Tol biopolymer transport system component
MLYDFSSGTQTMLVDRPAKESGFIEYAVMSPDGRSVAYSWDTGTARELRVAHVRDKNSPPRVLLRDETPNSGDDPGRGLMPTDWFPDGSAILVFRAREDGTSDIARVSTRDGTVTTLKRGLDSILSMNLSHDGRYVAYDRSIPGDNDARDLFLVSVDTGQEVSLVRDPAHDAVPLWTPDDRGVLFTSDRSGSYGLWLAPVSRGLPTGPPTIVRKDMGRIFPNSLADDGTLLYSLASGESDAYTAALGKDGTVIPDSVRRAASSFQGSNLDPEWSHDGRRLAFVSRRRTLGPRTTALVIHSQDGGDEQVLWPDLDSFTQPQWSPDGLWFVVRGRNNQGKRGPWLVNARTGAVDTRVGGPSGGPRFEDMDWAPDSRTLFIATGQTIGQFDVKSGRLEEIYRDSRKRRALGVRLSPDHTQLAITPGDETTRTLEILSLSNGMSRGVLTLSEPERFMLQEWTADGKGVLIVRGRNEGSNASTGSWSLWSVPAAGGVPRPLGLAGPSLRGVKASPDGIHIAFRMGEPTPDDWLMRNFLPTPRTP